MKLCAFPGLRRIFRRNRRPDTCRSIQAPLPAERSQSLNPMTISIPDPGHPHTFPQHSATSPLTPLPSSYPPYHTTSSQYPGSPASTASVSEYPQSQSSSPISPPLQPLFSVLSPPPGSPYPFNQISTSTPHPAITSATTSATLRLLSPSSSALSTVSEDSDRDDGNDGDDVDIPVACEVSEVSAASGVCASPSSTVDSEGEADGEAEDMLVSGSPPSLSSSCQGALDGDFSGFNFSHNDVVKDNKHAKCPKCGYRLDGAVITTGTPYASPYPTSYPTSRASAPGSPSTVVSDGTRSRCSAGSAHSAYFPRSLYSTQETTVSAMLYRLYGIFIEIEKFMDTIEPLLGEAKGRFERQEMMDDMGLLMREIRMAIERLEKRGPGRAL